MLLVVDQLEQWLFARQGEHGTELVDALRQCDGEHLQAICLVRDDFWMATTRFMRDLEIDLVPDRNIAAVDLFDAKHARKVLAAYGRAYGDDRRRSTASCRANKPLFSTRPSPAWFRTARSCRCGWHSSPR